MPKAPFIISIDGAFFVGETQKTIRRQQRVRKQEEHELDLYSGSSIYHFFNTLVSKNP